MKLACCLEDLSRGALLQCIKEWEVAAIGAQPQVQRIRVARLHNPCKGNLKRGGSMRKVR